MSHPWAHSQPMDGELLFGFHPLRDDPLAEGLAELDDRADQLPPLRIMIHMGHETSIDFYLVYRQVKKEAERRVAGAEIVERDANAVIAQF